MKQSTDHLQCALELLAAGCTAAQIAVILEAGWRVRKQHAVSLTMDALELTLVETVFRPVLVDASRPIRAP